MSKLQKTFWIALIVKLALSALIPLTSDEAYYWVWSQHMQLSYYDHPPFVAWLFWLGNFLGPQLVRWPGVLLGHATLAIWLLILKPFFSEEQRLYWLLLAMLSPLVGGTNLVVTPDLPLLFCNALALYTFYRWREKSVWWLALAFGFTMGLGFSAKYVMVLFPLSLFPLVLMSSQLRGKFLRQFGWIFLGAVLGAWPVWVWNIMNDFESLKFQAHHGLGQREWKPSWTIEYIGAQIGLIFPVILYWALRTKRKLPVVFHLLAWVPLLFFLLTTSRSYAEANWPIVAHPVIFALAVASYPRNVRGLQWTVAIWWVFLAALATIILAQPEWSKTTKFREFHQYDGLIAYAEQQHLEPLYARSYQMAAKMHFQLHRPVNKLRGMNRKDFYDYLDDSEPKASKYYLAVEKDDTLPLYYTSRGHKVTQRQPVGEFEIWTVEVSPP